jgi:hypothetical protein
MGTRPGATAPVGPLANPRTGLAPRRPRQGGTVSHIFPPATVIYRAASWATDTDVPRSCFEKLRYGDAASVAAPFDRQATGPQRSLVPHLNNKSSQSHAPAAGEEQSRAAGSPRKPLSRCCETPVKGQWCSPSVPEHEPKERPVGRVEAFLLGWSRHDRRVAALSSSRLAGGTPRPGCHLSVHRP